MSQEIQTEECSLTVDDRERYWVRLYPDRKIVVVKEKKNEPDAVVGEGELEESGTTFELRHVMTETIVAWVEWTVSILVKQRDRKVAKSAQAIAHGPTKRPRAQPTKKRS